MSNISSGAERIMSIFIGNRQTFLSWINREESELQSHLPSFPNIPKRHLKVHHIYTPTSPSKGKLSLSPALKKKNVHYTTTAFLPPPTSATPTDSWLKNFKCSSATNRQVSRKKNGWYLLFTSIQCEEDKADFRYKQLSGRRGSTLLQSHLFGPFPVQMALEGVEKNLTKHVVVVKVWTQRRMPQAGKET